jgi:hypothetical protein
LISLQLLGTGLIGPGLDNWHVSRPILQDPERLYRSRETVTPIPNLLRPNERRRTTPTIKLALAAAEQCLGDAAIDPGELCTVFASSHGDMQISDNMCRTLATEAKPVSPTQFHNSVHNAPAGYWSIGTESRCASTSLAVGNASFPAALMEAALQSQTSNSPVMLVCYDHPAPYLLSSVAPLASPFAVAMVVLAQQHHPGLTLTLDDAETSVIRHLELERIRLGNPAARALPLLQAIAIGKASRISIPYLEQHLSIELTPT